MCLFVCFKYCFCGMFVFRVVVWELVGPAGLVETCFISVCLCVSYVVFVFRVVVCAVRVGWVGGQVFHERVFVHCICCVSCGSVCWLGRLGWWTSEKKLLAGRSIRPAMMDRGETR